MPWCASIRGEKRGGLDRDDDPSRASVERNGIRCLPRWNRRWTESWDGRSSRRGDAPRQSGAIEFLGHNDAVLAGRLTLVTPRPWHAIVFWSRSRIAVLRPEGLRSAGGVAEVRFHRTRGSHNEISGSRFFFRLGRSGVGSLRATGFRGPPIARREQPWAGRPRGAPRCQGLPARRQSTRGARGGGLRLHRGAQPGRGDGCACEVWGSLSGMVQTAHVDG